MPRSAGGGGLRGLNRHCEGTAELNVWGYKGNAE